MATYNKRGYKAPKEKESEVKLDNNFIEDTPTIDNKDSATAKAFDALDQTASKTEEWVEKNQKMIFGVLAAIALVTVGYLLYQKFVVAPNQEEATEKIFTTQQNFQLAVDAQTPVKQDSLFKLVLNGSGGDKGALAIADQYSGTDSGNLANYYAGIASLNLKKYDDAIKYLEKFSSKDQFLGAISTGAIGDAYAQKNDAKKALEYYIKASEDKPNGLTTPRYLLKAGQTSLQLGNKADALKYFTQIKDNYESAPEAQQIDALIGMAQ